MSQHPWTSAGAMPQTTGGVEEMGTGDKGEDHQPEETYPHQGTETPQDALTVEKRDTMHATAPRRSLYPIMKDITNRPTLLTYKRKGNKTMKCKMPKNQTQWHQFVSNWKACPLKIRCIWQKKWESLRIFPWPN